MKKYRVWHGERYGVKEFEIVEAKNGNEAKQKAKYMFPDHKISTCWLIAEEKPEIEIVCTKAEKQGNKCLGYSKINDDEPIEKCKNCPQCTCYEE